MENTGERHIPDEQITSTDEYYNHIMHIATYSFAANYVKNKEILDYGCGSGYGAQMLSKYAQSVTATDIDKEAVDYARERYYSDNIDFKHISELPDKKFDVITSFQVIEHVSNDMEYIRKLKSKLKPNGVLLISTPNKTNRLFNYVQKPWNIYHLKEYSITDLSKLLTKEFKSFEILKIGSSNALMMDEINRTQKQKLVSLPCTLFFYPNFLRVTLLELLSKVYKILKNRRSKNGISSKQDSVNQNTPHLTIDDIDFNKEMTHFSDILAICNN